MKGAYIIMKKLLLAAAFVAVGTAVPALAEVSVHDPSVIKAEGAYYLFGTHITAAISDNLINWQVFTNGYTPHENTLFGELSENLAGSFEWAGMDDTDCFGGYAVWAPDVHYNPDFVNSDGTKGAYLMYYSASSTYKRSCIGLAAAKNVEGPYTYVDTLIYSGFTKTDQYDEKDGRQSRVNKNYKNTNLAALIDEGKISGYNDEWGIDDYNSLYEPNCIDPCVYSDTDGGLWLVYGSWSGGIYTLPLDKATGRPVFPGEDSVTEGGNPVDRYFGTKIAGGGGKSGEGPFIIYDAQAGYYFLLDTYEWLGEDGGYHIRLFRSKNPNGPFTDAMGRNALYGDNPISYQGLKLFGNYRFEEMKKAYKSGGHCSVLIEGDRRYLFYHTRFSDSGGYFESRVHSLLLTEDGWYTVAPYRYLGDSGESCPREEAVGEYSFINHGCGEGEGLGYKLPERIYLRSDGTIGGAVEGRWETDGKYASFTVGGVTYKGAFICQSDVNGRKTVAFSAAGSNNCCIWGAKAENPAETGENINKGYCKGLTV